MKPTIYLPKTTDRVWNQKVPDESEWFLENEDNGSDYYFGHYYVECTCGSARIIGSLSHMHCDACGSYWKRDRY